MITDDLSSHPHLPGSPILTRLDVLYRTSPLHAFLRLLRRSQGRLFRGDHNVQYCSTQYILVISISLTKDFHVYAFRWPHRYRRCSCQCRTARQVMCFHDRVAGGAKGVPEGEKE